MPRPVSARIGVKIAVVMGVIMLATAASVITLSTDFARSLGFQAADHGAEALKRHASEALKRITAEQARRYGAKFQRTESLGRLVNHQARNVLAHPDRHDPIRPPNLTEGPDGAMLTNGPDAPASLVYFEGSRPPRPIRQQMALLSHLDPLLKDVHQRAFAGRAAWLVSERGFVRYAPNLPLIEELPGGGRFDAREDHYYQVATPAQNPDGGPVWTQVYQDPAGQGLMVTAAHPIIGPDGTFHGVTGIDVTLTELVDQILSGRPLPTRANAPVAAEAKQFRFLADQQGRIIAFPDEWRSAFGLPPPVELPPGESLQQNLLDAETDSARQALEAALDPQGHKLTRFQLDQGAYLMVVHEIASTGWILGSVVAESRALAGVQGVRDQIGQDVTALSRTLIGVSVLAVVIALLAVSGYVRWSVVQPLRQLAQGAQRIKAGDYGHHVAIDRADELGQTGSAFNAMSDQLDGLVNDLEAQVAERTREAEAARHHFQSILENSPVGIVFLDGDRRIQQVNSAFLDLFPYRQSEVMGQTPDFLYADSEEFERIGREAYPKLREGGTYASTTHLKDAEGNPFPASLRGRAVNPADLSEGFIWAIQDITEQKHLEDELRVLAATFRTSQATMITDAQGAIERVNPAFTTITGYRPDEVLGRSPRILSSGHQSAEFYAAMWRRLREAGHWEGELWNRRKDGTVFPVYESISVVRDEAGEVQHFVAVFHDITEQKRLEAELDYRANHDPLTGLANRKQLEQQIREELQRADRYGTPFSLIMFDLDHFKAVNDRYGHQTGDKVLTEITELIVTRLREPDQIGRWGGEEFMILLPETGQDEAVTLAERLRRTTAEADFVDLPAVTISLGVTEYGSGDDLDQLTRRVDDALYRAKGEGRNRVESR